MTDTTIALSELAEKGADADFTKQTLQFALQRLVEIDVEALCRAAYGEAATSVATAATATVTAPWKPAPAPST